FFDFVPARNSAITGDNQSSAFGLRQLQDPHGNSMSFVEPVGKERSGRNAEASKKKCQQRRRGNSIRVEVTVNNDGLIFLHRLGEAFHSGADAMKRARTDQIRNRFPKEALGQVTVAVSASHQRASYGRREIELIGKGLSGDFVGFGD